MEQNLQAAGRAWGRWQARSGPPTSNAACLRQVLLLALLYVLISYPVLQALRVSTVTVPLSPQAGIALAALLCWGRRVAPGVFLGSLTLVGILALETGQESPATIAVTLAVAATLQALAAHWLLRRFIPGPLRLDNSRQALLYVLLGAGVANLVGPTLSILALRLAVGMPTADTVVGTWLDWWIGEAMGVLIVCTLLLTLLARPSEVWAPRRLSVALPLTLAALAFGVLVGIDARWERHHRVKAFERDAAAAGHAIEHMLRVPLAALASTRGLLRVEPQMSAERFRAITANLLRADAHLELVAFADASALRLHHVEPRGRNAAGKGLSPLLPGGTLAARQQAERTGLPVASEGDLQGDDAATTGEQIRVALLQTLDEGSPAAPDARFPLSGAVLVVLRTDALLRALTQQLSTPVVTCLIDDTPAALQRRLAGAPGCEAATAGPHEVRHRLHIGGRDWTLRLALAAGETVDASTHSKLFAGFGLLIVALLTVQLLGMAAWSQGVESLAAQRGRQLEAASLALRRQEQRFRKLFDDAPVGVFIADLNGTPLRANPKLRAMLGCTAEQLNESLRGHAAQDAQFARQLIDGQPVDSAQRVYTTPDGRQRHALLSMTLLRDDTGRPKRLFCVVQDLARQLDAAEQVRPQAANEAAEHASSSFLAHMSHELHTPLHGMLGFTQLLQGTGQSLSPQQRGWIELIAETGWHLAGRINDILNLSRLRTGQQVPIRLAAQDLHPLVEQVRRKWGEAARRRGITLELRLLALRSPALVDAERFCEVLSKLLGNAVKYNAEGGRVILEVRQDSSTQAIVSITDTGPGLDPEQLAAIFQPFNRLGQERLGVDGMGIDLAIARRLVGLMQGELIVQSSPGRGSTFSLRLPAAQAAREPAVAPARPARTVNAEAAWAGTRSVVYVEDKAGNVDVMRAVLAQRSALDFRDYGNGASALAGLQAEAADLVLLDTRLPDIDGLRLLQQLRRIPHCREVPILIVAAEDLGGRWQQYQAAGATACVIKPFDVPDLLARIDRLLAQHA